MDGAARQPHYIINVQRNGIHFSKCVRASDYRLLYNRVFKARTIPTPTQKASLADMRGLADGLNGLNSSAMIDEEISMVLML
ncbi:unnamed protein product [Lactuca virosa]|uniref:Uncharacterized protein n=1 Tax=Lactuca virosa TaxID=75947 RepID=A0AAU9PAQ5_9ASTR|nr:unnamed protein product [Lactuca virosa]